MELTPLKSAKRTFVVLSLALVGCRGGLPAASPTPDALSLQLLADSAAMPLLRDLVANYRPPNLIVWDIQVREPSNALEWLANNPASYALVSYLPEILPPDSTASPWLTPVGQVGIALVVHPSNPVADLTPDQIRGILQGRFTDWSQLGGSPMPIDLVAQADAAADSLIIQQIVMGDRRISRAARLAPTGQAVIELVNAAPGAFSYVSMGYLTPDVRVLSIEGNQLSPETVGAESYPIRAPLVFAAQNPPGDDAYRAFFAWVQSPEGQSIVRRKYGGLP